MNQTRISSNHILPALNTSIFLVSLPFFMLGMLLPIYGREMGASAVEIGLIFSAFSIMTILMRPLIGWALDRFGLKPFYIAGMFGYAVTMIGFAYTGRSGAWSRRASCREPPPPASGLPPAPSSPM